MIWVRQDPFLFSPGLLFRWKTLWGPFHPGRALGPLLPRGPPHSPLPHRPGTHTPPPPPVVLAHSEPDFLARRRSGCPQQLFLPSPKLGGRRCRQQEADSFQVTAREMGPFPPQPPIRGWGLLSDRCLGTEGGGGGAPRVRRGAFPGRWGASYDRCGRSHPSLQPLSWGPLVLPFPRVPGHLLPPASQQQQLLCQGHTFHTHPSA